ncbi:MAG: asparagine synthase (glutamine-hydrolyzing) [Ignavibacteria bacterium RIFOXYA12_FULL_35_25]|nr:MAG: asparagine synthase (glutamine-hydrolyzing) [Ignavibacteria bacterium GWF2_35_20]OGU80827.1 MAG: asparagine synthase (glutamine-hydrolyzing) [Ignavibacteria bacterium RIFOXYA2_FULL_35_9]OGU90548.1 MAG: asparagine synthase (glutamine-hydrolyzing) [Ignavibacteria bacterium RIFOXYA12_FULL_35_25]OGV30915.1 MAG: asparagine synthase (glutamine-hydrolyzing) [Ignavibacteria bacterium RIFOXYD12_FULL_36_8]
MCGIVGIINKESQNKEELEKQLREMRDTMVHRGPDGFGLWISDDAKVGFGHRRLSIIDLSDAGKQPMSNPEKTIWITFNGEIYNHMEIRRELENLGYKYHSGTDTETIIYAYQEWGIECLNKFNGMFAIGLWDERERNLYLIRDRVGVKPLYYTDNGKNFMYASEIKAFFKHPNVDKKLSEEGLYHYFSFGSTPAPFTLFKNIFKIPAGHYLKYKHGLEPQIVEWWNPLWNTSKQPVLNSEEEHSEYLLNLLRDSVKLRTISDVPYGAFLSGGLDSSLITALMTEQTGKSIDTYSIDVIGDNPYSEQNYANIVAKKFNSNHFTRTISDDNFEEYFLKNYWILDEPLTTQDFIALNHLSRLTRDNKTIVVQVGEGSDELFLGYEGLNEIINSFYAKLNKFSNLPSFIKKSISSLAYKLEPDRPDNLFNAAHGREFYWTAAHVYGEKSKLNLFNNGLSDSFSTYDIVKDHYKKFYQLTNNRRDIDISHKMLYMELKHRLPELLLLRVDKVGMANSIEPRAPFLDYRIVEFAFNIPISLKIKNGIHKYILKKTAEKYLPQEIIYRNKIGFCGSTTQMLSPKLKSFANSVIISEIKRLTDIFNQKYVANLFSLNNSESKIWTLLNFALWNRTWF